MIYFQIAFVVVLGFVFTDILENNMEIGKKKALYISICLVLCWLIASLRSVEWVASLHMDAEGYSHIFERISLSSWEEIFSAFIFRYFYHIGESDIGYFVLNKLVAYITCDYNCLSLIVTPLFLIPFGILLYKHTTNVHQIIFAFIFYIALIQIHMISGARQMFAIGFDIAAIMFFMERKINRALFFYIVGITIHFSSLITIIPILLMCFNFKAKTLKVLHLVSILLFPLVYVNPNRIIVIMGNLVAMEKYSNYGLSDVQGGANTFIFLIGMLSIFCFFAFNSKYLEMNKSVRHIYTMIPLLTFFGPLVNSSGSMMRISLYFFIYFAILIPRGIDQIVPKRCLSLAHVIVMSFLITLIFKSGVLNYHFMWQEL